MICDGDRVLFRGYTTVNPPKPTLTVGQEYEVRKANKYGGYLQIRNNKGALVWYSAKSFKKVENEP